MIQYHVQYSAEALEDLRSIYRYIACELQASQAAQSQINRIRKMIRSLSLAPARFSQVEWEPWASMGMRKVPVNKYVVFYLVADEDSLVTVVRIFYSGRNVEEIMKDDD